MKTRLQLLFSMGTTLKTYGEELWRPPGYSVELMDFVNVSMQR